MSTVDQVQTALMDRLLRGEVAPGTRLRQDELAQRLGVSKIPVREALQRLAGLGLLRFESNRGAVVPLLTAADAEEHFALRQAVEPRLLRRALPRLTVVDLAEAELALNAADDSIAVANWAFHRALYRASEWTRGVAIAEVLHVMVAPYVVLYVAGLDRRNDSDAEHSAMLDACRRRDQTTAVQLLERHLNSTAEALIAVLG